MKENLNKEEYMERNKMEQRVSEEFFRERKAILYKDVPKELDQAVLDYSRKNLAGKRFFFRLPKPVRAAAAILILALPITAVFLMESEGELPGPKHIAIENVKKSGRPNAFVRMDMADMELYQLNSELDFVQNVLVYSAREKQREKINF